MNKDCISKKEPLRQLQFFRLFVEMTYAWEFWRDMAGQYIYVTPSCERVTGYKPEDFYNDIYLINKIIHPDFLEKWKHHEHKRLSHGELETLDFKIITKSEEVRWIRHICQVVRDTTSGYCGIHSSNTDITTRKHAERVIEEAATKDPLTGLLNRRALFEMMEHELSRFRRTWRTFSIIICDIDNFKLVNDHHGHAAGDFVLKELASELTETLRSQDLVSRWGGEEFLILLPETDIEGGLNIAEKLRRRIAAKKFLVKGNIVTVTMSFGITAHQHGLSIDELIKRADDSLYLAKKAGRNRAISINYQEESNDSGV